MPRRDPDLLINDMLAAIRKIERYIEGMDQGQFRQIIRHDLPPLRAQLEGRVKPSTRR